MTNTEAEHPGDAARTTPPLMTATWVAATTDPAPLVALGASRTLVGLLAAWDAQLVGEALAGGAT